MPSTKSPPKKAPPARGIKASKPAHEIKDRDLDKVVGGLRSAGGPRPGDPCEGGE